MRRDDNDDPDRDEWGLSRRWSGFIAGVLVATFWWLAWFL